MSMSKYVQGIREPDERWRQMKTVWDTCRAAGVAVPEEVERFFNWEPPDEAGIVVELDPHPSVKEWGDDHRDGFEVEIAKLPPNITKLRFVCSY
jgi:hypothetical protein